ncbi:MAG: cation:proton antiporter [Limisphaerales bacterium]
MRSNLILYLVYTAVVVACGVGIWAILQEGKHLELQTITAPQSSATSTASLSNNSISSSLQGIRENLREPLSLLLVQLILIILLARLFAAVFVKLHQPAVIGEMVAGIVLGPSVIGTLFPGVFQFVFPPNSLGVLRMLSQIGVILFMFVVGMELDVKQLRSKARTAVMVSHASIVFPYFLGVLVSLFIYRAYAASNVHFTPFALFMGIAMSITAFPVLARIIEERGLTKTQLGSTALTCAAVDDVTAWTILAFVVAFAKSQSPSNCWMTIILLVAFFAAMILIVKPSLQRALAPSPQSPRPLSRNAIVAVLVLVFACGLLTEVIGIHALFGAFMAGVCMPQRLEFRAQLRERLESFSSAFLLPLFFAFTGLRTQIGLLNDWQTASICLGLIAVATLGKLGGSMIVARWTGMNWRDSFALGAMMNTRGLVELIVLNVGFDLGILSPRVFTMMVVMALVTTCMTGPLLSLAMRSGGRRV